MSKFYYEDHPEQNIYNQPQGQNIMQQAQAQQSYGQQSYGQDPYGQDPYGNSVPYTNQYGQQMGNPYSAQYAEAQMQSQIAAERAMLNGAAYGTRGQRFGRAMNAFEGNTGGMGMNGSYGNTGGYGIGAGAVAAPFADVLTGSFMYMFIALLVTGITALATAQSDLIYVIIQNYPLFFGLLIGEIVLVFITSSAMKKNNVVMSAILFGAYCIVNGITLSIIFLAYTQTSITKVFFITAALFGGMAVFGKITHKDLSGIGSICLIGLIGIILASVVNWFLHSTGLEYIITIVGIVIFLGLTAYDVQKIKRISANNMGYSITVLSLWGAMELYLDFINLFLKLLRLMGKRR